MMRRGDNRKTGSGGPSSRSNKTAWTARGKIRYDSNNARTAKTQTTQEQHDTETSPTAFTAFTAFSASGYKLRDSFILDSGADTHGSIPSKKQ
jgi:hypothetical protein